MRTMIILLVSIMVSVAGQARENKVSSSSPSTKTVVVEVDFGNRKELKSVSLKWEPSLTALEALQKVAEVKTHPVGDYVFVTEIDQVESERGKMAWYYTINGKSPKQLAISQPVKAGDTIRWRYVKDVCSEKVDGTKCAVQE